MKILITGATGLVGTKLMETLFLQGHTDINIVSRNKEKAQKNIPFPVNVFQWDPCKGELEAGALEGVDTIFHLAGESVAEGRWTKKKKERILCSRIKSTKLLMSEIEKLDQKPRKFISASAIGIYGDRGSEELHEKSDLGTGFLADVCVNWESHVHDHNFEEMKSHSIRIGIVLAEEGGALQKMLPPFKAGVGGILGNGKQFMSWVHIDDLVGQFIFLMDNDIDHSIFNGVSPQPVDNYEFTKTLGKVLSRPTIFPVPSFGLKVLFGEMSEILLASQRVFDHRFSESGYQYKFSTLESALTDLLKHSIKGEKKLKKYQWVDESTHKVFNFFSDEKNLEKITPGFLNFKVLGKSTDKIQKGTLIDYSLSLHGIPLKWKTRINAFEDQKMFIDEQLKGPYTKWVHLHEFYDLGKGTLVKDEVVYKIPLGGLGSLLLGPFIRKDLNNIFSFRHKAIYKLV